MGNRSSKKKSSKRGLKTDTTPGANRNSQTPELRDASSPRQPFQSEASASQFESIPHRETPAASSSTNTNFRASDKQTTPVRKKYSDPLTIEDKKQILIDGLKEKYKLYYDSVKPLPYIQDRLYCVNTIFVESGVVALSDSATSYGKDALWEQLDSYKNIFNDPHRRSNRRIIEGEPGYGKSTLTLQLAYDWCNGVQDSPLADVEILILLRLRQLGKVPSIYRAIKRYLVPKEYRVKERDIKEILESCKSVAFQLDGYDEYPGRDTNEKSLYGLQTDKDEENDVGRIIKYKMFQESDVTLTTRYLPNEYDRAKTKRFKLTGFDETARDQYIRKAVCGDDEVAIAKVKKGLKENVILDDLCQIPLLFTMFSHMTHEIEGFQKFKSVTDFLRHAMNCFHSHTRNKSKDFNAKEYSKFLEHNHNELDKIAFEGLSKENQQIIWSQAEFLQRLGQDFYDQYILVGILVEEDMYDVADGQTPGKNDKMKIEVRFYHKLFCEWFASFRVVDILCKVEESADLEPILGKMDPFDLQYVFRFACGLNSTAGKKIIQYLKSKKDGDKFAILCILEQSGNFEGIVDTVKEICSSEVFISKQHSKLLQRSTIQLLQIASSHEIPISNLLLQCSFSKVDKGDIVLQSGLCLPTLSTLEKLSVNANRAELTKEDVIRLLNYGVQSKRFKELWFYYCKLPASISPKMIPETAKSRNIKVLWPEETCLLNLQSGKWKQADDIQTITELCSNDVVIDNNSSQKSQKSAIELLKKASRHDIPIYCVYLDESFNKVDEDDITLYSGLSLPIIASIERMSIVTEEGREMNKHEVNGILNYLQHSQRFKQLEFYYCLLPPTITSSSLANLRARKVTVFWDPYGYDERKYLLDLQSGRWLLNKDPDSFFPMLEVNDEITDADYANEVEAFRNHYSDEDWQLTYNAS
ncbi:uncharacterized protein [Apostichopus japonicus]|uniref:uncharacterized protein isoform X2 n=1 Tax=Stichopus japonicus TaxID=307972 RepID=UPI003AB5FA86